MRRLTRNVGAAWQAIRCDPWAFCVQAAACLWGVALLVGLFSPIKGFEQETLELLQRNERALAAFGFAGLPPEVLEARLAKYVAWREEHIAKWNRGIRFVCAVCLGLGVLATMNTALSQLKDRVRELAIRKACGAGNRDVFLQVCCEGAAAATCGGGLGIALGLSLARVGADLIELPYHVSPELILLGFVVAFASGVLASLWPAARAARVDPAVALREL